MCTSAYALAIIALLASAMLSNAGPKLPEGFLQELVVDGLCSPSAMGFGPGGKLFVAERVVGELRVISKTGILRKEPVLRVVTPRNKDGSMLDGRGHRSGGLRGFAFDPDFPRAPYLYVYYMHDTSRHNRLSRFTLTTDGLLRALPDSEKILLDLPFCDGETGGSHNGGAVAFGADGKLYVTTGDGFDKRHDPVQSLTTFTGKVLRLNKDGSIPRDNPFFGMTSGSYRSIYALGLRNPYNLTPHPKTGEFYLNDCSGKRKASIYKVSPGANFGVSLETGLLPTWKADYQGVKTPPLADAAIRKQDWLVTGGAWYPSEGSFPKEYHGSYFVALWGFNNNNPGAIHRLTPGPNGKIVLFAEGLGLPEDAKQRPVFLTSARKPASLEVGPDGHLYWLATTYRTSSGAVFRIRYKE